MTAQKALSVLIPTYNHDCTALVNSLLSMLQRADIPHEIIVAEDGSTDAPSVLANHSIATLPCCRHIVRKTNVGRAAIRNFLAREARYDLLLYIDSDMLPADDQLIRRYLDADGDTVIDGGVTIPTNPDLAAHNLRYRYEEAEAPFHTAIERQKTPYQHLHTANLLIRRDLILSYPFDERFRNYGYEDILLGKTFRQHQVPIQHIDNPVVFDTFETNASFVAKTEEGLRTLRQFRHEMKGYSRLLTFVNNIHIKFILTLIRIVFALTRTLVRKNLCGSSPKLLLFKFYRLGYYLSLP